MREGYESAPPASELTPADRAMLDFAVKLTREPRSMTRGDVEALRAAGFTDTAIHDVVQITGLFAYYNRLADGLGIEPEIKDLKDLKDIKDSKDENLRDRE